MKITKINLQKQESTTISVVQIKSSIITNSSGDLVEQTFYDPYGSILSGGQASRFDYEGKEFSQYTEDYDYNLNMEVVRHKVGEHQI